jgi:glycosyltransferase involved in cell wall biosynthesis
MPTRSDYRCMAVLEAMRFGKPVIDSLADGNAGDTVRDRYNGFLVGPDDPGQLVAAMRRFVDDPALAKEMGPRSKAIIADLTPAGSASRLVELFTSLQEETREQPATRAARMHIQAKSRRSRRS